LRVAHPAFITYALDMALEEYHCLADMKLPPEISLLGTLAVKRDVPVMDEAAVRAALEAPIWPDNRTSSVFDLIHPGESACFVISDYTRKTATDRILPAVADGLAKRGCRNEDWSLLVASGIHRPPTDAEIETIIGSRMMASFEGRIFRHDPDDESKLASVGRTPLGHDVRVNRLVTQTDRLVLIGAATYHYHAGFGGGRKSLVPGVAARDTIAYNHSLTLDPDSDRIRAGVDAGNLDGNVVSDEMLAGARLCKPDIIINTVLAPDGRLAGVFSGDLDIAHRAACARVETLCRINIPRPADLVIASAIGAPNWVQSHKALFNASRAVAPDGWIILVAPCPEGLGDERFRYWVRKRDPAILYRDLRTNVEILGQTALSSILRGRQCLLVTDMPEHDTADLGIRTAASLAEALTVTAARLKSINSKPTAYLMPEARYVVPFHVGP
jgi:nickel-dependent lactate racemase